MNPIRTAVMTLLLCLTMLVSPRVVAAQPETIPPGMAKYVMLVWTDGMPLPDGRDHAKNVKEPDVEKYGGKVLSKHDNRREILLPKGASKQLRKEAAVIYLQRIWMGEPLDDWDETYAQNSRFEVETDSDTGLEWEQAFQYDGSGNIKQVGQDHYTYDSAGRLLQAEVGAKVETYTYDAFGNLIQKAVTGTNPVTVTVDGTTNRIVGTEYDAAGNVTLHGRFGTQYDSLNMPVRFNVRTGTSRRMLYDADDEQIGMMVDNDSVSRWTIRGFGGEVLREFKGANSGAGTWYWQQDRIYADGRLVAGEAQEWQYHDDEQAVVYGGPRHYHLDHLGNVRLVTDRSGRSISEHDYYPFGTTPTRTHQEQPNYDLHVDAMRFAGHWRDYMGLLNVESTEYLDYMHARYYDPNLGRFLSVDPVMDVENNVAEPQRWNRYAYVTNNPLKYDDPDGREKRIMVVSVVEDGPRFRVNPILNQDTHYVTGSGYDVQVQHGLGAKSLLHALSKVDGTGTDIPVIMSHGVPLQSETGGGPTGSRRVNFGAAEIGAALDGKKAQAIVLAACGSMGVAQGVANRTNTIVFGITAGVTVSSRQVGRSGAILADIYAKTTNAAFAIAVANRTLTRSGCTPGGQCDPRPQWHYAEPEKK